MNFQRPFRVRFPDVLVYIVRIPECGRATTGPQAFNEHGVINIGVGAHITEQQPLAASVMINRSPQKSEAPRIIVFGFAKTAQS
jgi:hypothetical protein